jgi:carboxylate-amine ligase
MAAELPFTIGVEEEFLLLDAATGHVTLVASDMLRLLDGEMAVAAEFMRYQIETATVICSGLGQVRSELSRLRGLLTGAADRVGCLLVASGVLPFGGVTGPPAVTDRPRYRLLAARFPDLVASAGTCGCHVHIGVPSRELGIQVLSRLRPWLPQLLAISANSPYSFGRDTGWASWRHPLWSQWPTARPPEIWTDTAHYDVALRELVASGAAIDPRGVHLYARLSPRYPTVEIRITDVCLSVDEAVLLAGLVRAMVATAVGELREGRPAPPVRTETITAALNAAAQHGLDGAGIDVVTGESVPQRYLFDAFLDHVRPGLAMTGDGDEVERLAAGVAIGGTGADRQRALWAASATPGEFVVALADATMERISPELLVDGDGRA